MESELKTLKEFLPVNGMGDRIPTEDNLLTHENLKQEAIKWMKELNSHADTIIFTVLGGSSDSTTRDYEIAAMKRWIKHFFNITEKDLK